MNIVENKLDGGKEDDVKIRFFNITKKFPHITANKRISFEVKKGTIHSILGENGAGKTTLMNILNGIIRADSGKIFLDGHEVSISTPRIANRYGIGTVQQFPPIFPSLRVRDYLFMRDVDSGFTLNKSFHEQVLTKLQSHNLNLNPQTYMWEMSPGEIQWLEMFRLLNAGVNLLVLDEPTSLLSPDQGNKLLKMTQDLARRGNTIILVTHKLNEVIDFADYVTVLRDGQVIDTAKVTETSKIKLAELMVGGNHSASEMSSNVVRCTSEEKPVALEVKNLSYKGLKGNFILNNLNFALRKGEILGVAGVSGNGQEELAKIVAGMYENYSGSIYIRKSQENGTSNYTEIRYIPTEKLNLGAPGNLTILENLILRDFTKSPISNNGLLNQKAMISLAKNRIKRFSIQAPNLNALTSTLSGGNIQRLIISRELDSDSAILVAHNPTSGLDIKATVYVRKKLKESAVSGKAVLLISTNLEEVFELADLIMVLSDKKIKGPFIKKTVTITEIGALMAGHEFIKN